ncbi:MAG: ATP-binding cassette domain-containing protein [Planctomycetota bacterium]
MSLLEIKNLHVSVDGQEILRGLDLVIEPGETHAIMGPNGSGKSTLAQVLAGKDDYDITEGSVLYKGKDLLDMLRAQQFTQPVIALTAHAMAGVRQRCLDDGFTDYATKPIDRKAFYDVLRKYLSQADPAKGPTAAAPEPAPEPQANRRAACEIFDLAAMMDAMGGEKSLALEVLEMFLAEEDQRVDLIRQAVADQKAQAVNRSAHSLKGALGMIHAPAAFEAAFHLETLGEQAQWDQIPAAMAQLEAQLDRLRPALRALVDHNQSLNPTEPETD